MWGAARPDARAETGARPPVPDFIVVIDPGHGGGDPGVVGPGGFPEAGFTLALARQIRAILQIEPRVKVFLTRDEDESPDLDARASTANRLRADVFLSLHAGGGPAPSSVGFKVFFHDDRLQTPAVEAEAEARTGPPRIKSWRLAQQGHQASSKRLALELDRALSQVIRRKGDGPAGAPVAVLTGADRPAVLIEIGNLTRAEDEGRLSSQAYRDALTRAVLQGLDAWRRRAYGG
ncbi:MAG: N-acetylmuramoyl-L-alanine amidase [Proteobacteria bacterium]|nr:N-acetylmuramoyl-L-alanine amidase [Pseudomonadota bacterium]